MVDNLDLLIRDAQACQACALAASRTQVVVGEGCVPSDLMIIGEGPGAREDELGRPFVGRSGGLLDRLIAEELGRTREQIYIANVVKCRPPNNRDPRPEEMEACASLLDRQLKLVAPRVVLLLGRTAVGRVLGTKVPLGSLRGRLYDLGGVTVIPTYHPAFALRGGAARLTEMRVDFARVHLLLEEGRP
ncbi:uracil-DNA glycosylase [Ferrimicrobium acidiphilum]|uniref:uracil-DNA glycosylase n=1 Tax=Ferrimicrobium acidiphilum TaxID=121039 RepID=UPI00054D8E42|nr:uracil-DNA glycosylase [Ferrimicrobium acidiphilum]MCL5053289.1 uracil-DNA glycosylase [Gammaproteobacteria bacterium]